MLSQKIVIGSFFDVGSRFLINFFIHIAWQAVDVAIMYSASLDEMVTIGYFLDAHETIPLLKLNEYPSMLFLSSTLLAKSLSMNLIS